MAGVQEVIDEYTSSLAELTMNKKPLISMLTILAEDYVQHAPSIVEAVEAHLQKVRGDIKLPALYLIDSIIKTISRPYLRLFSKNIVNTFCSVFEKVDEKTRANMWKLRETWSEVFHIKKLFALDVRVHSIDPAWPIVPLPPGILSDKAIKKLKEAAAQYAASKIQPTTTAVVATSTEPVKTPKHKSELSEEVQMHEQLLKKQKELIELQKQKIELELFQAKANLAQQRKQLGTSTPVEETDKIVQSSSSSNLGLVSGEKPFSLEISEILQNSTLNESDNKTIFENAAAGLHPRDPRIKTAVAATLEKKIDPPSAELTKQEQLIEHLKQQIQAKLVTEMLLNDAIKEAAACYKPENVKPSTNLYSSESIKKEDEKSERPHISTLALMSNSDYTKSSKRFRTSKSRRRRKSKLNDDSSSPDQKRSRKRHKHPSPSPESPTTSVTKSVSCLREEQIISMQDLRLMKRTSPEKENKNDTVEIIEDIELSLKESPAVEIKEDLDLRVVTIPTNKRKSELLDTSNIKKKKAENYDPLFGNKDVDLRISSAVPLATPIFSNRGGLNKGSSWAKIKSTPNKNETPSKPLTDRDRLGRPRVYKKFISAVDPTNFSSGPIDTKQNERNIEIIMKQAAEHLNQGTISKAQYNTIIQEVLHICEDQKLRTAQRKEQEMEKMLLEGSVDKSIKNLGETNENIPNNLSSQPIPGQADSTWPSPWFGPWIPPPPMPPTFPPTGPDGFRPMGPWQNSSTPFSDHLRPDFSPSPFGLCTRMSIPPPIGPTTPIIMPNRAMAPVTCNPINPVGSSVIPAIAPLAPPGILISNGPVRPEISRNISPNSPATTSVINTGSTTNAAVHNTSTIGSKNESVINYFGYQFSTNLLKQLQLPNADKNLIAEIERDTMKSINIDGTPREIRYYGTIGVVFLSWNDPRDIVFQDGSRRVIIDGKHSILVNFNDDYKEFFYGGESHTIKLGTPTRELYINDKWYECCFGGRPITVELGGRKVNAQLDGPIPQVKVGNTKRIDLVIGKINLIINARTILPIFLDAKPQIFEIEDQKCTLEFTDSLQVVRLNGRPFNVEFGGLPKPIIVAGKKHYIRFSGLPHGYRPGLVKIKGMKGETTKDTSTSIFSALGSDKKSNIGVPAMPEPPSVPPGLLDGDSNSQDCIEITSENTKSDSHLDVLSSVVPSAMAPSSGMSYQAEPMENPPAKTPPLTMPLNLSDLLQKLVDIGVVRNHTESKNKAKNKEKKNYTKIIPVSFDKPESLKLKQPGIVSCLYNGMQCSSCGVRFLPEMAARYSHHLDWHFRQNRKERESAKKAHSRPWLHDVGDWIQFEEIEDLDDRVQSWFELEKQAERDNETEKDSQPSIPTGLEDKSCCEVCQESFEQFYNEEKEEWHFRPALIYENKSYHPQCFKDHQISLEKSAEKTQENLVETDADLITEKNVEKNEENQTNVHVILEVDEDDDVTEITETEIDEQTLNNEKNKKRSLKQKKVDKGKETGHVAKVNIHNNIKVKEINKNVGAVETKKNIKMSDRKIDLNIKIIKEEKSLKHIKVVKNEGNYEKLSSKLNKNQVQDESEIKKIDIKENKVTEIAQIKNNGSNKDDDDDDDPIEIIEPTPKEIIIEDLSSDDEIEDKERKIKCDSKEVTKKNDKITNLKVEKKEEDKIPDDVPLIFPDVKIKQEPVDEPEEKLAKAGGVDTTQVAVKSSIDGNVELDFSSQVLPSASSKIKINITKTVTKVSTSNKKILEKKKPADTTKEVTTPARPMIPAAIKPSLQGKKMSILPTVEKGHELSGFCTVM